MNVFGRTPYWRVHTFETLSYSEVPPPLSCSSLRTPPSLRIRSWIPA